MIHASMIPISTVAMSFDLSKNNEKLLGSKNMHPVSRSPNIKLVFDHLPKLATHAVTLILCMELCPICVRSVAQHPVVGLK